MPTETEKADIGPTAKAGEPHIEQLVIAAGKAFPATPSSGSST